MSRSAKRVSVLIAMLLAIAAVHDNRVIAVEADRFDNMDTSIEGVCRAYPQRVARLFDQLNMNHPGLEATQAAAESGDMPAACRALLKYYRTSKSAAWLRTPLADSGSVTSPEAQRALDDTFTIYGVTAKVPRTADGRLDWEFTSPTTDEQWTMGVNRHYQLRPILAAYRETGNRAYASYFDKTVRDWITAHPYPSRKVNGANCWAGLQTFFRTRVWSRGFFALQPLDELTPAARILILSSIPDHAHYLQHYHMPSSNWITMEMNGLATAAVCWPEFKDAPKWLAYSLKRMGQQINDQVYLDGAQHELTSMYHWVALRNIAEFAELIEHSGQSLPKAYRVTLERMWHYLAYTMRPDGHIALNNDSDRTRMAEKVLAAAELWQRPDWTYIATQGKQGTKPKGEPSAVFPWAGHVVMRNGWNADAHWAFFDVGPLGGHVHFDKLHLSIAAYGRDLLIDGGRYTYTEGPWREYFQGSAAHNVILIDGQGQKKYQQIAKSPMKNNYTIQPDYDMARGTFDGGYRGVEGKVTHTRTVLYVRNQYWVVVDKIDTDQPRKITALWHLHPDCTVEIDNNTVATTGTTKGHLRIVPLAGMDWNIEIIKGQTDPIQGWWSREYNHKTPSPCAAFTTHINNAATFAWVIAPGQDSAPPAELTVAPASQWLQCQLPQTSDRVQLRTDASEPVRLTSGNTLDGDCAILRKKAPPIIIGGKLRNPNGDVIAKDPID